MPYYKEQGKLKSDGDHKEHRKHQETVTIRSTEHLIVTVTIRSTEHLRVTVTIKSTENIK